MKQLQIKTCPMCGKDYADYPAISRTSGKEEICSNCGVEQALQSLLLVTAPCQQTINIAMWAQDNPTRLSFLHTCYQRHTHLDWGDISDADKHANDVGLTNKEKLFSSYKIPEELQERFYDSKVWIITEYDRSKTTILFPCEY